MHIQALGEGYVRKGKSSLMLMCSATSVIAGSFGIEISINKAARRFSIPTFYRNLSAHDEIRNDTTKAQVFSKCRSEKVRKRHQAVRP